MTLNIGPWSVDAIETGQFGLDGGAMFGIIPKTLWEKTNPADPSNRIEMRLRVLLLRKTADKSGPPRNVLVDCGIGENWSEKHRKIYDIDHTCWSMENALATKNLKKEDITDIILTHLHFDHAGGLTASENIPCFPNAKIYIQRKHWEKAQNPSEKDRRSFIPDKYSLYSNDSHFRQKLELIETDSSKNTEILPGISVQTCEGHTPGMQTVWISDGTQTLIHCADLIPTSSHVPILYIMAFDCYPMITIAEKKALLNRALTEKTYLFYGHCPSMSASRVIQNAKGDFQATDPMEI